MHFLSDLLLGWVSGSGYWGVFILMAIESSFVPFPSELIIPPAGYLAFQGEMSLSLIILIGVFGSLVGAFVNYYLGRWLGRPLVYLIADKRWSSFLLINKKKVIYAEDMFLKYGAVSTFLGRLLPAVRQLISLPAGFVRMNVFSFAFFTALGAGIWVTILAFLGYYFGANEELLASLYSNLKWTVVIGVIVAVLGIGVVSKFLVRRRK